MFWRSEILDVLSEFAWGGCVSPLATSIPKIAIVGHNHADHLPVQVEKIITAGKINSNCERIKKMGVQVDDYLGCWGEEGLSLGKYKLRLIALRQSLLKTQLNVETKGLHTTPILVEIRKIKRRGSTILGCVLYIDDFDLRDVPIIKDIIKKLKTLYKGYLKAVMLPLYSGARAHGTDDPKELAEASRDLVLFASDYAECVVGLGHPVIPTWFTELRLKFLENFVPFEKKLLTLDKIKEE